MYFQDEKDKKKEPTTKIVFFNKILIILLDEIKNVIFYEPNGRKWISRSCCK